MKKYNSPFSVGNRKRVYISEDDPRNSSDKALESFRAKAGRKVVVKPSAETLNLEDYIQYGEIEYLESSYLTNYFTGNNPNGGYWQIEQSDGLSQLDVDDAGNIYAMSSGISTDQKNFLVQTKYDQNGFIVWSYAIILSVNSWDNLEVSVISSNQIRFKYFLYINSKKFYYQIDRNANGDILTNPAYVEIPSFITNPPQNNGNTFYFSQQRAICSLDLSGNFNSGYSAVTYYNDTNTVPLESMTISTNYVLYINGLYYGASARSGPTSGSNPGVSVWNNMSTMVCQWATDLELNSFTFQKFITDGQDIYLVVSSKMVGVPDSGSYIFKISPSGSDIFAVWAICLGPYTGTGIQIKVTDSGLYFTQGKNFCKINKSDGSLAWSGSQTIEGYDTVRNLCEKNGRIVFTYGSNIYSLPIPAITLSESPYANIVIGESDVFHSYPVLPWGKYKDGQPRRYTSTTYNFTSSFLQSSQLNILHVPDSWQVDEIY